MNEDATKLESAESNLKKLMADVSRAMEKAEEAITRITTAGAATGASPPKPSNEARSHA